VGQLVPIMLLILISTCHHLLVQSSFVSFVSLIILVCWIFWRSCAHASQHSDAGALDRRFHLATWALRAFRLLLLVFGSLAHLTVSSPCVIYYPAVWSSTVTYLWRRGLRPLLFWQVRIRGAFISAVCAVTCLLGWHLALLLLCSYLHIMVCAIDC